MLLRVESGKYILETTSVAHIDILFLHIIVLVLC